MMTPTSTASGPTARLVRDPICSLAKKKEFRCGQEPTIWGGYISNLSGETHSSFVTQCQRLPFLSRQGGTYEGEWLNRAPHGQGRMEYSDGTVYVGGWQNFKFHGYGKLVQRGVVFEGEWSEGRMHGSGSAGAIPEIDDARVDVVGEQELAVGK